MPVIPCRQAGQCSPPLFLILTHACQSLQAGRQGLTSSSSAFLRSASSSTRRLASCFSCFFCNLDKWEGRQQGQSKACLQMLPLFGNLTSQ